MFSLIPANRYVESTIVTLRFRHLDGEAPNVRLPASEIKFNIKGGSAGPLAAVILTKIDPSKPWGNFDFEVDSRPKNLYVPPPKVAVEDEAQPSMPALLPNQKVCAMCTVVNPITADTCSCCDSAFDN